MELKDFVAEIWDGHTNHCEHIDVIFHLCNLLIDEINYNIELKYKVPEKTSKKGGRKNRSKKMKKTRKNQKTRARKTTRFFS